MLEIFKHSRKSILEKSLFYGTHELFFYACYSSIIGLALLLRCHKHFLKNMVFINNTWQSFPLSPPEGAAIDDGLITSAVEKVVINIPKLNKAKRDVKPSAI